MVKVMPDFDIRGRSSGLAPGVRLMIELITTLSIGHSPIPTIPTPISSAHLLIEGKLGEFNDDTNGKWPWTCCVVRWAGATSLSLSDH